MWSCFFNRIIVLPSIDFVSMVAPHRFFAVLDDVQYQVFGFLPLCAPYENPPWVTWGLPFCDKVNTGSMEKSANKESGCVRNIVFFQGNLMRNASGETLMNEWRRFVVNFFYYALSQWLKSFCRKCVLMHLHESSLSRPNRVIVFRYPLIHHTGMNH